MQTSKTHQKAHTQEQTQKETIKNNKPSKHRQRNTHKSTHTRGRVRLICCRAAGHPTEGKTWCGLNTKTTIQTP